MLHAAQQGGAASQMLLQGQTLNGISTGSHHHACEALRFSTAGPVWVPPISDGAQSAATAGPGWSHSTCYEVSNNCTSQARPTLGVNVNQIHPKDGPTGWLGNPDGGTQSATQVRIVRGDAHAGPKGILQAFKGWGSDMCRSCSSRHGYAGSRHTVSYCSHHCLQSALRSVVHASGVRQQVCIHWQLIAC